MNNGCQMNNYCIIINLNNKTSVIVTKKCSMKHKQLGEFMFMRIEFEYGLIMIQVSFTA